MSNLAEKLASRISFEDFKKATELKKRLWFTLGILIIYRLGSFIPLPGVDASVVKAFFDAQSGGGFLGMFDVLTGGNLSRMTVFALNIMPYISASIIISLMSTVYPSLIELKKEGEAGREKINQYTRYLTVAICIVQAYGMSVGLEQMTGASGISAVYNPGWFFRFSTIVSLTGGTMFVMWLGEQITARGIGQGASLIIFSGIIAGLPGALFQTAELGRVGQLSGGMLAIIALIVVSAVAFVVFIEQSQRRVLIHYPKQTFGAQVNTSHLPLKLNTAGVIPPIFAGALLNIPSAIAMFAGNSNSEILQAMNRALTHGSITYYIIYAGLIAFFAFFYTALQFNSKETADNLKNQGAFIPGIRPGDATAKYFDYLLSRTTVIGASYLVAICLLPDIMITRFGVPFYLGGTTLLIVCNVISDTVSQIQAQLVSAQYQGIIDAQSKQKRRFVRR
ncbi:MAG: preprotein translocase subunit SecY [Alphaproteobacteria bacterium]|nr:preprotein translocase subunit SecY [Alphaproteobacteria bacterium]